MAPWFTSMRDKKPTRSPARFQPQETLEHALSLHQAGRLKDAESLYRTIIQRDADNADALHLLGMVAFQTGRHEDALGLLERAISRQPKDFAIHNNLGLVLREFGQGEKAEACFRRALEIKPDYPDALLNLGALLDDAGQSPDARHCYDELLTLQPGCIPAWNNRGRLAQREGRYEAAVGDFLEALAHDPHQVDAYANLGMALSDAGKPQEALVCLEKALLYRPESDDIQFALAVALERAGERARAEQSYRKVIELQPGHAAALNNLGLLMGARGDPAGARTCFERATEAAPHFAEARCNLAELLRIQDNWEAACHAYERTVALEPSWPEAWNNLGIVRRSLGRTQAAIDAFRQAIALRKDFADAHFNLGNAYCAWAGETKNRALESEARSCYETSLQINPLQAGALFNLSNLSRELRTAIALCERAVTIQPDFPEALVALMASRLKACDWRGFDEAVERISRLVTDRPDAVVEPLSVLQFNGDPQTQLECARNWVRNKLKPIVQRSASMTSFVHQPGPRHQLRIGYLSGDFRDHAVGNLLVELFARHDRGRFSITGYCVGPDDKSEVRAQLKAGCDQFVEARSLSTWDFARQIYKDRIDILVDLTGHTENTRSEVLALRPAPIQVNYLGYPGSMGAKFMDYIIADCFLIPDPATCDEKVVYLPGCFQVNPTWHESSGCAPLSRTELGLPEDAVVFCCFNSSYKIQPAMFRVWMELLKSAKQSVLWLAQFNDLAAHNLRQEAVKQGIAANRLLFAPVVPLHEHMRRLPAADLFLDTSPYSAGATASHTLWAGVPLLTLAGDCYVSRMAGSLVTAVGCPELIAHSVADYRDRAMQLSFDSSLRGALRSRIANNRGNLFNCDRFTKGLERAYQSMWQRFEQKLTPECIDLTG